MVDVFTAVALSAILGRLLRRGAIIVATSNCVPSDLNKVSSCGNSKACMYSILLNAHGC